LQSKILMETHRKIVKDFLDIIILARLRNAELLSGYEIMGLIHQKLGFLISSGTVYSLLYSMERKGLIKGELTDGKRVYALTDQGKSVIDAILGSKEELLRFVRSLLDGW
jgi:DNA-binding PadR family transcriptional regulator